MKSIELLRRGNIKFKNVFIYYELDKIVDDIIEILKTNNSDIINTGIVFDENTKLFIDVCNERFLSNYIFVAVDNYVDSEYYINIDKNFNRNDIKEKLDIMYKNKCNISYEDYCTKHLNDLIEDIKNIDVDDIKTIKMSISENIYMNCIEFISEHLKTIRNDILLNNLLCSLILHNHDFYRCRIYSNYLFILFIIYYKFFNDNSYKKLFEYLYSIYYDNNMFDNYICHTDVDLIDVLPDIYEEEKRILFNREPINLQEKIDKFNAEH